MLKFIHAADFHLDSAFGALSARQAASRRAELRETVVRLSDYVNKNEIQLVLLAGDLFDSSRVYTETGEQLAAALGRMQAKVLIAPGNHDWYGPGSPWVSVNWPENVHVFRESRMTAVEAEGVVIHGAAFTGAEQTAGFLRDFTAPEDGRIHIGLLHGEIDPVEERYNPIQKEEIASSGLTYLALGHTHKRLEPRMYGKTLCAWPGCIEGRGFDELGEKGFYEGCLDDNGKITLRFVPFSWRRYERLEVDVTGQEPGKAVEAALPEETARHLYRLTLVGETDERGVNVAALQDALAGRFYALEVRDRTRMAEDIWRRAEEDSLRGLFLRQLREQWNHAKTEEERERVTQAVRFGLAALDYRDLG